MIILYDGITICAAMLVTAAIWAACASCPAEDRIYLPNDFTVYSGRSRTRGHTGDFLTRDDGSILFAYSRNCREANLPDLAKVGETAILARISSDKGQTWGEPFLLQPPHDDCHLVLHPSFLRLPNGEALFAYNWNKDSANAKVFIRRSTDGGMTWGPAAPVTDRPGYHIICPNRLVRLKSGRILAPIAWTEDHKKKWDFECLVYYSDDNAHTWKRSVKTANIGSTSEEPAVVELKDGRLLMYFRNNLGYVGQSFSGDGGETWSKPTLTSFTHPRGPLTLARIPRTGDLLFFWLNNPNAPDRQSPHQKDRTPLVCAISKDDGETWSAPLTAAEDPEQGDYGYVSLGFIDEFVLVNYHTRYAVHVARVPVSWFYPSK